MTVVDEKMNAVAQIIEGSVIKDQDRVDVLVKGEVFGFRATLEAFRAGWPFGVSYMIETRVVEDPNRPRHKDSLYLSIVPRHARGILAPIAHLLLFEGRGQHTGYRQVDAAFISSFNNRNEAARFYKYPGVFEKLRQLENFSKFSELIVNAEAGLSLSQPKSFKSLDLDVLRETFKLLGELGQVLSEAF